MVGQPVRSAQPRWPLAAASEFGIGVVAKRALGNAPWHFAERPLGQYCDTNGQRMQQLACEV
jgi:hypothetical protein